MKCRRKGLGCLIPLTCLESFAICGKIQKELSFRIIQGGPALLPGSDDTSSQHCCKVLPLIFSGNLHLLSACSVRAFCQAMCKQQNDVSLGSTSSEGGILPCKPQCLCWRCTVFTLTFFCVSTKSRSGQH